LKNDLKVHTKPSLDLSVLVSMRFLHHSLTMSSTWTDIIHSSPRPLDSSSWHFLPKIVPNSDFSFLPKTETIMLVSKNFHENIYGLWLNHLEHVGLWRALIFFMSVVVVLLIICAVMLFIIRYFQDSWNMIMLNSEKLQNFHLVA